MKIIVAFYRTLASQSSASLTANYLAAHLRHDGYCVELVQLIRGENEHDVEKIIESDPSLVFYKPNFKDIDRLEANLKALSPIPICLFGPFAVLNAHSMIQQYSNAKMILMPNQEYLASSIVRKIYENEIREQNSTLSVLNQESPHNKNTWDLWPVRDIESSDSTFFVNIEATRGCHRGCTFCHVPVITDFDQGNILRRDPEDVINEMEYLWSIGKRYFIFNDSIFGGGGIKGLRWLEEFAAKLSTHKHKFLYYVYLTLNELVRYQGIIEKLASCGLIRVFVGIESSNQESLRKMHKGIDVIKYQDVKRKLIQLKIYPHIGFMLFHPFAKPDEIIAGIDFLGNVDELHRFGVVFEKTRLIPGSFLFKQVRDAGLLLTDNFLEIGYGYMFAHTETEQIYNRYQKAFKQVGVPIFERIEHLFVTAEFIFNLTSRDYNPTSNFKDLNCMIQKKRIYFVNEFKKLCMSLSHNESWDIREYSFASIWQDTESLWGELILEASKSGLTEPLAWISTGDLNEESKHRTGFEKYIISTRSGLFKP